MRQEPGHLQLLLYGIMHSYCHDLYDIILYILSCNHEINNLTLIIVHVFVGLKKKR